MKKSTHLWRAYLLFIGLGLLHREAISQPNSSDTNKLKIIPFHTNIYAEGRNGFMIGTQYTLSNETGTHVMTHPFKSLVVKVSQGKLENLSVNGNSEFYWVSNLKPGKLIISAFKQVDTGVQLLNTKGFKVIKQIGRAHV